MCLRLLNRFDKSPLAALPFCKPPCVLPCNEGVVLICRGWFA